MRHSAWCAVRMAHGGRSGPQARSGRGPRKFGTPRSTVEPVHGEERCSGDGDEASRRWTGVMMGTGRCAFSLFFYNTYDAALLESS